ncbi:MAG: class II fumarate hydratase [Myxococcota bacterium]|jgi:fumarate hydratase class II
MTTRIERDTFGPIEVPAERLWGAQTQRSLHFFPVSRETMPKELIAALARVKRAAAAVNARLGVLDAKKADAIVQAADEVLAGRHDAEFPLSVWQTGSGTQTNMNVNEVLANRASELLGGPRGEGRLVHPNDDVNHSQSSNDVFPTAMHLAAAEAVTRRVLPALGALENAFDAKAKAFAHVVKLGRTHLQDATPLTVGQELSAFVAQLAHARAHLEAALPHVHEIALGGTAVGTGLNAPKGYASAVAEELARLTGLPIVSAPNKFEALATCDALVHLHGALKGLATSLFKVASDVRLLASGPRAGLGELRLPENEPGSSIMPGKVNPTQCEMLTMVAARVLGNDTAVTVGGMNGHLQLNVFRPLVADAVLQSCRLLADGMEGFRAHLVEGLEVNEARTRALVQDSLMLVTALAPHVGYDQAAAVAKKAHADGTTLREAALALGVVSGEDFDRWVTPERMLGPE